MLCAIKELRDSAMGLALAPEIGISFWAAKDHCHAWCNDFFEGAPFDVGWHAKKRKLLPGSSLFLESRSITTWLHEAPRSRLPWPVLQLVWKQGQIYERALFAVAPRRKLNAEPEESLRAKLPAIVVASVATMRWQNFAKFGIEIC